MGSFDFTSIIQYVELWLGVPMAGLIFWLGLKILTGQRDIAKDRKQLDADEALLVKLDMLGRMVLTGTKLSRDSILSSNLDVKAKTLAVDTHNELVDMYSELKHEVIEAVKENVIIETVVEEAKDMLENLARKI